MQSSTPPVSTQPRYKQLDSLRGLAALTVFLTHFLGMKAGAPLFQQLSLSPLGVLVNGNAAVMFFFVLSGFVLSLPFVDNNKPLKLTAFYTKRVFRIYPAFMVAIIFSILLKDLLFDKTAMAAFTGWIHNFWDWDWNKESISETLRTFLLIGPKFNDSLIDPPIWSLVIEMQISIVLPFFIMIVSRGSVALNMGLLLVIVWLTYPHDAWALPVFYIGILMAKYKGPLINMISSRNTILIIVAVLFAILLYNNSYEFPSLIRQIQSPFKYTWSKYLMAAGGSIIMMLVLARKRLSHFFEHRIFVFFGDISYSFYLIHAPILLTMASVFTNRFALSPVYIFLSAFILAVTLSYLMFIFIEKPFQQFAKRLTGKFKILNSISI